MLHLIVSFILRSIGTLGVLGYKSALQTVKYIKGSLSMNKHPLNKIIVKKKTLISQND